MDLIVRLRNVIGAVNQPKDVHSMENLKHLYNVLQRNRIVSNANRQLLTETLRSLSEILIWGDQNDTTVVDYCLKRGILVYFLDYLHQRNGRYVCIQILQTLNMLFENIRSKTLFYYLLSNNHVNHIIIHKFDFNDEEIAGYYISFLKTLSLKLNESTIHFFFNEHNRYFPLYVEAIKLFNHHENMVRIAVQTITLNVYRVSDSTMHRFILDCTATEYFSNLIWFIRNYILEFDHLIHHYQDANYRSRLHGRIEGYIDHLYYFEDIFLLNVDRLNNVLKEQLMNRLIIPLYLFSLNKRDQTVRSKTSRIILDERVALFLLAEIFLVLRYRPVVEELADIILSADIETVEAMKSRFSEQISFSLPPVSLDVSLAREDSHDGSELDISLNVIDINNADDVRRYEQNEYARTLSKSSSIENHQRETEGKSVNLYVSNWTDDEKSKRIENPIRFIDEQLMNRPFFQFLIEALQCQTNDQLCFYALNVLLTMTTNPSIDTVILESVCLTVKTSNKSFYNSTLVDRLCDIIQSTSQTNSIIRIVTLNLTIELLIKLVYNVETKISFLSIEHLSRLERTFEELREILRRCYQIEEIFLDLFEDEYGQLCQNSIRLEQSLRDASLFYPITTTTLNGTDFVNRLPSNNIERTRWLIRVFLMIRQVLFLFKSIVDEDLPLTKPETLFKLNANHDWNDFDLISCTVHFPDKINRLFLVTHQMQFILIEPDIKRSGWGIVKFSDLIQNIEISQEDDGNRSLRIVIDKSTENLHEKSSSTILNAKLTFDDRIRRMNAEQILLRARENARQTKLNQIGEILQTKMFQFDH